LTFLFSSSIRPDDSALLYINRNSLWLIFMDLWAGIFFQIHPTSSYHFPSRIFFFFPYGRQSHKACVSDYIPAHTPACIAKYMASSELWLVHQTFRRRLSLILLQAPGYRPPAIGNVCQKIKKQKQKNKNVKSRAVLDCCFCRYNYIQSRNTVRLFLCVYSSRNAHCCWCWRSLPNHQRCIDLASVCAVCVTCSFASWLD
jgi:hypothetical protein